ncbi:hypothetical protein [Roseibacillus ishigakijimensis]|uniref:hypothetical protein n=1 Tax=Roseibacillus ishigakijimensis TaxID=454146 RepID=UPI003670A71B
MFSIPLGAAAVFASFFPLSSARADFEPDDVHWYYDVGGPSPEPFDFALSGRYLYTGGLFLSTSGVGFGEVGKNLVRYDTVLEQWEALPGLNAEFNGGVFALHAAGGKIYIGGNFSNMGGAVNTRVAVYDPATATFSGLLGGGLVSEGQENGPTNGDVRAILKKDHLVYVGGFYTGPSGSPENEKYIRVYNLNTQTWSRLGNGLDGRVEALALLPDGTLLAGGGFSEGLARWNGTAWSAYGGGIGGEGLVNDIVVAPDGTVYVGGSFTEVGAGANRLTDVRLVAAYDPGSNTWDNLAGGFHESYVQSNGSTFAADGVEELLWAHDRLYAVGDFQANRDRSNQDLDHIAYWDGSGEWKAMGSGVGNTGSQIVNCIAPGPGRSLFVGGTFSEGYRNASSANAQIALWDDSYDFRGGASERNYDYVPGARYNTTVALDAATGQVTFESRDNTDYKLLSTPDLSAGTWNVGSTTVFGDGEEKSFSVPLEAPRQFFRLQAE